jgi:adenylate cyclase
VLPLDFVESHQGRISIHLGYVVIDLQEPYLSFVLLATDRVNQQSWQLMPSNGNKFAKNWHLWPSQA